MQREWISLCASVMYQCCIPRRISGLIVRETESRSVRWISAPGSSTMCSGYGRPRNQKISPSSYAWVIAWGRPFISQIFLRIQPLFSRIAAWIIASGALRGARMMSRASGVTIRAIVLRRERTIFSMRISSMAGSVHFGVPSAAGRKKDGGCCNQHPSALPGSARR